MLPFSTGNKHHAYLQTLLGPGPYPAYISLKTNSSPLLFGDGTELLTRRHSKAPLTSQYALSPCDQRLCVWLTTRPEPSDLVQTFSLWVATAVLAKA